MSRTARKPQVSAQFFRVDGADQETGEETYLVLQAPTKPHAEKLAREQGLLISAVRVARPDDWSAPPPPPDPAPPPETHSHSETPIAERQSAHEMHYATEPVVIEPTPFVEVHGPTETAPEPLEPAPALPSVTPTAGGSSAGPVVLGCIGGALLIGGALALVLALWPDNAVRNELQQIDFRLHEVSQTILGGMLVLGGLVLFVLAVICHLLSKRNLQASSA